MTANAKSVVLLAATLVVGFTLGLFADATLVRGRRERIGELRRPPGFVAHMEEIIKPHSDAQRDSIRPILEAVAIKNSKIVGDSRQQLKVMLDSMSAALAPMLDAAQRERLTTEVSRGPIPFGPGGRGGRGRRGGPPAGFGPGGPPP